MLRNHAFLGAVLAFYFLVGRWTPSRMEGEEVDVSLLLQPRTWAVAVIAALGAAHWLRQSDPWTTPRNQPVQDSGAASFALWGLLLLIYMASTVLWAPWQAEGSPKFSEIMLLIVVQISLLPFLGGRDLADLAASFWLALMGMLGLMAALGLAATFTGRAAVLGGGPNVFGRNMGLMMIGAAWLMDHDWRHARTRTLRFAAIFVVGGLLVAMSGSRGAMAATAAGVGTLMYLRRTFDVRRIARYASIPAVGLVCLAFTEFGQQALEVFHYRIVEQTYHNHYTSDRDRLFYAAIDTGLENPWCGLGLDSFRNVVWNEYPHNFFLETFAEGGFPGLLLALVLMAVLATAVRRRGRILDSGMAAAFAVVLAAAQFSGDLYDSRGIFLFGLFALAPMSIRVRQIGAAHLPDAATAVSPGVPAWRHAA